MRIIAGLLRGRKLKSPRGGDVRPTSDKVKEAVFSMLLPYMEEDFVAMDVFTGSGNLGLEAISRGAKTVYFSDSSRESLRLAKENVQICGVEDNAVLLLGDFRANIKRVHEKVNIFLVDPPYADGDIPDVLRTINEAGNLAPGGAIVCEHLYKDRLPEELHGFTAVKDRRYGAIGVTMYEKAEEPEEDK